MSDAIIFEKLTQSLTANQDWPLHMAGDTFRIVEAFWPVSLTLKQAGRVIGTITNVQAGDYVKGIPFDEVIVNSAIAQNVTVLIASGGSGSDRISGSVEVLDGGLNRTLSNSSFLAQAYILAGAGSYPAVQLLNPATNTQNLYLESFLMSSTAANTFSCGLLASDIGGAAGATYSKLSGGVDGAALIKNNQIAAAPAGVKVQVSQFVAANSSLLINFREPVCINPGYGFVMFGSSSATSLLANVEFFQE